MIQREHLFIGGQYVKPINPERIDLTEAATGEPLGRAACAGAADIDAAVAAARAAFPAWSSTPRAERAAVMERMAQALTARGDDTSRLVSRENGMSMVMSPLVNVQSVAGLLMMYAAMIRDLPQEEVRASLSGHTIVRQEPVGVVAAIAPWNYPQVLAMMKIAPALAAGCTVVFKAAPYTALDAFVFADAALEAGLPPGVLNVVPAEMEGSVRLVEHPGVDKVAFTGSTPAGRAIAQTCGRLLRPVVLELGGKSAGLVLEDVDLDVFAQGLYATSLINNGQTCYASTRILAPESRYEEIVDAVTAVAAGLKVGNPLDADTLIGPMASAQHRDRVLGYIEQGKASGARLTTGGGAPAGGGRGHFVAPTVFADVKNTDTIAQEEIFGPVLSVIKYGAEADGVRLANESIYGLGGTVWSADEAHATDVARRIESGTVGINAYNLDFGSPFGGVKASGYGRELGPEALYHYLTPKSIFRPSPLPGH